MSSRLGLGGPTGVESARRARMGSDSLSRYPSAGARGNWERRYALATIVLDVVAIAIVVVAGYVLGLGKDLPQLGDVAPGVGIVAALLMLVGLVTCRAWDPRVLGQGAEEFSRVIRAVVTAAVALGLLGLAIQATAPRPWVFGLMPAAGVLAVAFRLVLRGRLHRRRDNGECALSVLVVGEIGSAADLIDRTQRDNRRGWVVGGRVHSHRNGGGRHLRGHGRPGSRGPRRGGGYRLAGGFPRCGGLSDSGVDAPAVAPTGLGSRRPSGRTGGGPRPDGDRGAPTACRPGRRPPAPAA